MSFATRLAVTPMDSARVTLTNVGGINGTNWYREGTYGSASPVYSRNGYSGLYAKTAIVESIQSVLGSDVTYINIPFVTCPGGVDPGSGFLTGIIFNGTKYAFNVFSTNAGIRSWGRSPLTFTDNFAAIWSFY